MKLIEIYNKIKKNGLKKSYEILKEKIYITLYLYEIDLEKFSDNSLKTYSYKFMEINQDILKKIRENKEISKQKFEILKDRIINFKETMNYVVLDINDNIVGYFSISLKNTQNNPYIPRNLTILEESSYFFDDYTFEKYRRMGVHSYSLLKRMEISKKLGKKKSIILTYLSNKNAQNTIEKVGMKKVCKVYKINLFRRKFIIYGKRIRNM